MPLLQQQISYIAAGAGWLTPALKVSAPGKRYFPTHPSYWRAADGASRLSKVLSSLKKGIATVSPVSSVLLLLAFVKAAW